MAKSRSITQRRRKRVRPAAERLAQKSFNAIESVLDAVAEDPEAAMQKAGEFFGRLLDTVEQAHEAYARDPEGTKREIRNTVVGAVANAARKKKRLK